MNRSLQRSLDGVPSAYTNSVVARIKDEVTVTHDYHAQEGAIPIPATFSVELADALTDPASGFITCLYNDFPFELPNDGGPRDDFETTVLNALRTATDVTAAVVRYENVNGRWSLRYTKSIVMQVSCVQYHNTHPQSPKKDWNVKCGALKMPLPDAVDAPRTGWFVTLAVMLSITLIGVVLVFVIVRH